MFKLTSNKIVLTLVLIALSSVNLFGDNIRIIIEITGVVVNGGNVHVDVFTNEQDYRRGISFTTFVLESRNNTLVYELELPEGYCLIWAFQDTNNNGRLDTNIFGIPREPVAMTNYSGIGNIGNFNRHKIAVNSGTAKISINLAIPRLR